MGEESNQHSQTTDTENASQGGQPVNDNSGEQNQPFINVEQLNRALTSYNKRVEANFTKMLEEKLSGLNELLEGVKPQTEEKPDKTSNSKTEKNADPEVLRLQKQIEDLKNMYQKSETEKQQANQKAKEERVKSEALSGLTALGVQKGEQVYKLIRDQINYDEETGKLTLRYFDQSIGMEDEKDLKSGLVEWLNNEGSHFLPPRNVNGSGASNKTTFTGNKTVDLSKLNSMKPSEMAKIDLRQALGDDTLRQFINLDK